MTVFNTLTAVGWLFPLIALVKIIGGILVIIPKFRAFGAIIIFSIMVGILLTHNINNISGIPISIILMGMNLWINFEEREKYIPMIR